MNTSEAPKIYYSVGREPDDPVWMAELKIKRSVFTCRLAFADSPEAARAFITAVSRENKTATHNCWAYVVGEKGQVYHASDAGEPSGTAGKPMLNALFSHDMTQVAAVVTRVYGGVKLGVKGLISAYSDAVLAAIEAGEKVRLVKTVSLEIDLPYDLNDILVNRMGGFDLTVLSTDYGPTVVHRVAVAQADLDGFVGLLSGYRDQGRLCFKPI